MNRTVEKMTLSIAAIAVLGLGSCNFSKGVKKDLNTGLQASYSGISIDDIYLADSSGKRLNSNKISLGSPVVVQADGAENFTTINQYVFPGCQIVVTDNQKNELLNLPDAFASKVDGQPAAEAKTLKGIVYTGSPMVVGETYHLRVRFFDKKNAENELIADADIVMKE